MKNDIIFEIKIETEKSGKIEEVTVTGKINVLEKYYLEVEIIHPYVNWIDHLSITGIGKLNPNNFLITYPKWSELLLKESYQKLAMIDEDIDRLVRVYDSLMTEIELVNTLPDSEEKEDIIYRLNDWFFRKHIFISSVTGLSASIFEEEKIIEILTVYKHEKRRIYKKNYK